MADVRGERREFLGEDREDAIAKACQHFGVEPEELEIGEFAAGEVYGLAGRSVVVAEPRRAGRVRGRAREEGRSGGERGGSRREPRERRESGEPRERREPPELREPEMQAPSVGTGQGELGEIGSFALGMIERMDLGPFEIGESQQGKLLVVEVQGPAARKLASGDGRPVDALQLLANQRALRLESESPRVVVDVEGDPGTRESFLEGLAQRVARRARDTGRAVALDPMNPRDRRIIHLALRDEEDVATMSVGEGRYRQVVVVPEGAPEFEEAQRESAAAATRSEG